MPRKYTGKIIYKKTRKRRVKGVVKAIRKAKRRNYSRRVQSATETKLVKHIDDNSTSFKVLDAKSNVFCPYITVDPSVTGGNNLTHWVNQHTEPANLRNFIHTGTAYNQRIGRKIRTLSSSLEMTCFLNNPSTHADKTYPLFATLRIIQGWVKGGYHELKDLMNGGDQSGTDGYGMYDELPYSKYKILKDYVVTRYPMAPFAAPGSGVDIQAVYKLIKIKCKWAGQNITFQDSIEDEPDRGWSGWCPFLLICNPQADDGGTLVNALNLRVDYMKQLIPYKDA